MSGNDLLSDQGLRIDGRKPSELRRFVDINLFKIQTTLSVTLHRIRCSLGIFSQADGSAYLEQGNTKVLAAVYGPHEVNMML